MNGLNTWGAALTDLFGLLGFFADELFFFGQGQNDSCVVIALDRGQVEPTPEIDDRYMHLVRRSAHDDVLVDCVIDRMAVLSPSHHRTLSLKAAQRLALIGLLSGWRNGLTRAVPEKREGCCRIQRVGLLTPA